LVANLRLNLFRCDFITKPQIRYLYDIRMKMLILSENSNFFFTTFIRDIKFRYLSNKK